MKKPVLIPSGGTMILRADTGLRASRMRQPMTTAAPQSEEILTAREREHPRTSLPNLKRGVFHNV